MSMKGKRLSGWVAPLLVLCSAASLAAEPDYRLVESARNQDWQQVQELVKDKADARSAQPDGATALAWAVYWDNLDAVNQLIAAGADVNAANDYGVTPLNLACKNRNPAVVKALLEAKADPNIALWSGETPLMTAARTGVTEVVQSLLEHGANINVQEPKRGQTALMWAISFRNPEVAKLLIEKGADVSLKTRKYQDSGYSPMVLEAYAGNVEGTPQGGYNALMFAARVGDMETSKLLLARGSEINESSAEEGSALVIASAGGFEELALYLLEQGADPKSADANGMTSLHYAMRDGLKLLHGYEIVAATRVCGYASDSRCKPIETVSPEELKLTEIPGSGLYIVEGTVDTNNIDEGASTNEILPGGNMYELAEALLAKGADPDAEMKYPPARLRMDSLPWLNLEGATPFFLATASLDTSAMEMLLEHGAKPLVSTRPNPAVLEKQTKVYADDNQILGNGSSLMVAVGLGKKNDFTPAEEKSALDSAKRLVTLGADVNEVTATGWTALHAASFVGANSLVSYLVEQGAKVNVQTGCGRTPLSLAEGESVVGLLDRTVPHESTASLLKSLGADDAKASAPAGQCVLGRGGLEVDVELKKQIEEAKSQL
jgi:ankyrin repeat protein